jgi:hypothetical protein
VGLRPLGATAPEEGDSQTRREILGELFEELDVREGEIVGYKARDDGAAEVSVIMESIGDKPKGGARGYQTLNLLTQLPPGPPAAFLIFL